MLLYLSAVHAFPGKVNIENHRITFEDNDKEPCDSGEVCKSFAECEAEVNEWKISKKFPKTCYFKGKEQFVCCKQNPQKGKSSRLVEVGVKSKKSKIFVCDGLVYINSPS